MTSTPRWRWKIVLCLAILSAVPVGARADDPFEYVDADKWLTPPPYEPRVILSGEEEGPCHVSHRYPHFGISAFDDYLDKDFARYRDWCERVGVSTRGDEETPCPEYSTSDYTVCRASNRLLSVFIEGGTQGACGPPYHVMDAMTFDLESGTILETKDFFARIPEPEDVGIPYYVAVLPAPEGMLFICSGGMSAFMEYRTLEELAPFSPRLELWR